MTQEGKVFNVEHVDFEIEVRGLDDIADIGDYDIQEYNNPHTVVGISEEGFGITPTAETELIPGLKGFQGFSVDPQDGAEASLTLKSTSRSLQFMTDLYNLQQLGKIPPFKIEIIVQDEGTGGTNPDEAFGFQSKSVDNAFFVNFAPFETEETEAPDYEFEFVGYGYNEEGPGLPEGFETEEE